MDLNVTFPGGVRVDAHFAGFTVHTDQPVKAGGDGTAPSPFALFQASLATCAGYYVASFCQQRGLPTDGIRIIQSTESEPGHGRVSRMKIEIHVPETFPEKYRAALVRAAEQCTVKKLIEAPPAFDLSTVVDSAVA